MDKDKLIQDQGALDVPLDLNVKKNRSLLLHIFFTSDLINPGIWRELRSAKKLLLENMKGNLVRQSDVNDIFWAYARINKDIYIPFHLQKYLKQFSVQMGSIKMSVTEYLDLLHSVRIHIDPIGTHIMAGHKLARKVADKYTKDNLSSYTEFGKEEYFAKLDTAFANRTKKTYPSKLMNSYKEKFILNAQNNSLALIDVVEYFILYTCIPGHRHEQDPLLASW